MTDLRESMHDIIAVTCSVFEQYSDDDVKAGVVIGATDAIMSEIAKARVKVKPLGWEYNEKARYWGADTPFGSYWINVSVTGQCAAYAPDELLSEHLDDVAAKAACRADYERRIMDAVEIVSELAALQKHFDSLVARDVAATCARIDAKRKALSDREIDVVAAPSEPAPVVTDAMVEAAAKALWCHRYPKHDPAEWGREDHPVRKVYFDKARAVLTAALPHAKTEAQVRADWAEKLARWVSDGYAGGEAIADAMRDFARSQADGGE